ncbi:MAG: PGF-pre-PGF domain-containing protein [Methanosarcina sp.]
MKTKKKLYSIALVLTALALVYLISVPPMALASNIQSNSFTTNKVEITTNELDHNLPANDNRITASTSTIQSSLTINEARITTSEFDQVYPSVYSNRIVWEDDRNGNWDIYMYDLSTSREIQITNNGSNQTSPDIYGERIVWEDDRNGNWDIYMYDLSTSREIQITNNELDQGLPVIYGEKIVWEDERNGILDEYGDIENLDIYMYDLSTSRETQITTNEFEQSEPFIYGDRIVYIDDRSGNWDIYMYDLSISRETQITTNGLNQELPAIYGDKIVYSDDRNGGSLDEDDWPVGNWDIYMYDLSTSRETQITTDQSVQAYSAIYDNRIVWEDYRNGNSDIYMYNLSTSLETQITTNEFEQYDPDTYGNRVVWWDGRNGNWDIYMCTVSGEELELEMPVANFSSSVTKGYVPLTVQFTDSSQNAVGWNWNFGDGTNNSTEKNPIHTYSAAGTYSVNLIASNANGTNSKLATITVLEHPVYAYITNFGSNTVSVIDTATNTVTATVPVGIEPLGVAVALDGTKVYVTNNVSNSVSVIDTSTNTVTATINVGNNPTGVAINLAGTKVYVTNNEDNTTSVIDTATNTVTATVPVEIYPSGVAVSPDGTEVYVASSAYIENSTYNSTVSVIDTSTNTVTATVSVGSGPMGVTVSPDGRKVYVANSADNTTSVIDTSTNTVTFTVPVGSWPVGVAVNPDGTKVYVANYNGNSTSIIDTATNTVTATVKVGNYPFGIAVTPDGRKVYVANSADNTISVIDTSTNTVTFTVPVGSYPFAFGQFIGPFQAQSVPPVPNFSANVTSGYVPLSVQFTDQSKYATSRTWDFGDGTASTEQNPMHTYFATGTYIVNLTVSNGNNFASKTATITVLQESSSSGGSSGGSSHGSSGGGGGSPEPARNVDVKELSQTFITNGKETKFNFTKNATCVVYVGFDAKKTVGKTTTIVEQLKNKSTLVSELSEGEVYRYFNVWAGNSGFATEKNIENPVLCFKVEKSWIQDEKIDTDSITLNRYSNKTWEQLPVSLLKEDSKYLYFTADVPGYSFFAVTGKAVAEETIIKSQPELQTQDSEEKTGDTEADTGQGETTSLPGFVTIYGVASLFALYLYKRK